MDTAVTSCDYCHTPVRIHPLPAGTSAAYRCPSCQKSFVVTFESAAPDKSSAIIVWVVAILLFASMIGAIYAVSSRPPTPTYASHPQPGVSTPNMILPQIQISPAAPAQPTVPQQQTPVYVAQSPTLAASAPASASQGQSGLLAWQPVVNAPVPVALPEHVFRDSAGVLQPEAGYVWEDSKLQAVKWSPGSGNPNHPHVVAGSKEGNWQAANGYRWVSSADSDLRVTWNPGAENLDHPHVVAGSKEGNWQAANGYRWVSSADSDLRVTWNPGAENLDHPHVVAGSKEGNWQAANGYRWVSSADSDLRVTWNPGAENLDHPHVVAGSKEGNWQAEAGYRWASSNQNDLRVELIPSQSSPVYPPIAENGSYYGEPNNNGVPKTVYVQGYYRSDGTYVRGYYRSPPNTNPPR